MIILNFKRPDSQVVILEFVKKSCFFSKKLLSKMLLSKASKNTVQMSSLFEMHLQSFLFSKIYSKYYWDLRTRYSHYLRPWYVHLHLPSFFTNSVRNVWNSSLSAYKLNDHQTNYFNNKVNFTMCTAGSLFTISSLYILIGNFNVLVLI